MSKSSAKSSTTLGTVAAVAGAAAAGAAVGAAAVVMSDPKKVKQIKTQVNKQVTHFIAGSEETLADWKKEGRKIVSDVEDKVEQVKAGLDKKLSSK